MEREKGSSLIANPKNFVVVDIETTGFSTVWDSIIEVAAIRCVNEEEVEIFTSLIQPPKISDDEFVTPYIEKLTGITNEMLNDAPSIEAVLPDLYDFIGSSVIVGHNVNFDINFLYDNFMKYLDRPLKNDFIDTMRLSRRLFPDAPHHRLSDLCSRYSIDYSHAHRSLIDCRLTLKCYQNLIHDIKNSFGDMDSFLQSLKKSRSRNHSYNLKASDIHAEYTDFDISHPLYKKVCVFTGALEKMIRKDAMQLVANLGGINADSVTKKTNFLILGNNDYCKSIKDGKSSKQKKAEKLKLDGYDIEILPETAFYEMLDEEY